MTLRQYYCQDGGRQPCYVSSRVVLDRPRRAVHGVSFVIKF